MQKHWMKNKEGNFNSTYVIFLLQNKYIKIKEKNESWQCVCLCFPLECPQTRGKIMSATHWWIWGAFSSYGMSFVDWVNVEVIVITMIDNL